MSQCFKIDAASACGPEFEGYSVPITSAYSSSAELSNYINGTLDADTLGARLSERLGCDKDRIAGMADTLRYQATFTCAYVAYYGVADNLCKAGDLPNGPLICHEQCEVLRMQIQLLFQNTTTCPLTEDAKIAGYRANYYGLYETFCQDIDSKLLEENGGSCSKGIAAESEFCGFETQDEAMTGCVGAGDTCCIQFMKLLQQQQDTSSTPSPTKSRSLSSTAITSGPPASGTNANSTATPSTSSLYTSISFQAESISSSGPNNITLIAPIVAASIALIAIVVALTAIYVKRKRARGRNAVEDVSDEERRVRAAKQVTGMGQTHLGMPVNSNFGAGGYPTEFSPVQSFNSQSFNGHSYHSNVQSFGSSALLRPPTGISAVIDERPRRSSDHQSLNESPHLGSTPPPMPIDITFATNETSEPEPLVFAPTPTPGEPSVGPISLVVTHPYAPTLADELELNVGDDIIVLRAFDDGWALGLLPATGAQGAFPLVCVAEKRQVKPPKKVGGRVAKRASSLILCSV